MLRLGLGCKEFGHLADKKLPIKCATSKTCDVTCLRVTASTVCKLVVKYYYYYLLSPTLRARWPLGGPPTLGGHSVGASLQTRNSCPQSSDGQSSVCCPSSRREVGLQARAGRQTTCEQPRPMRILESSAVHAQTWHVSESMLPLHVPGSRPPWATTWRTSHAALTRLPTDEPSWAEACLQQ